MMFDNIRRGPLYYGLRLVHLNMVSPPEIGTHVHKVKYKWEKNVLIDSKALGVKMFNKKKLLVGAFF